MNFYLKLLKKILASNSLSSPWDLSFVKLSLERTRKKQQLKTNHENARY